MNNLPKFIKEFPPIPDGYNFIKGQESSKIIAVKGHTVAPYEEERQRIVFKENEIPNNTKYMSFTSKQHLLDNWGTIGGVASIEIEIDAPETIDVNFDITYWQDPKGTKKATAVSFTVKRNTDIDKSKSESYNSFMNTDQKPGSAPFESPTITLYKGVQTLTIDFYIANNNTFFLEELQLIPKRFISLPYEVNLYWKCAGVLQLSPDSEVKHSIEYSSGIDKTSSKTQSFSKKLGLSVNAGYASIGATLSADIEHTTQETETITFQENTKTTTTSTYTNSSKTQDKYIVSWQPIIEYIIESTPPVKLIEDRVNSLRKKMYLVNIN